jgi:hypothetical protein
MLDAKTPVPPGQKKCGTKTKNQGHLADVYQTFFKTEITCSVSGDISKLPYIRKKEPADSTSFRKSRESKGGEKKEISLSVLVRT